MMRYEKCLNKMRHGLTKNEDNMKSKNDGLVLTKILWLVVILSEQGSIRAKY